MTLDELTMIARAKFESAHMVFNCTETQVQAAVLAVLDAVERECVPQNFVADPKLDYEVGYNYCCAEMLRRLTEMRK